MASKWAAWILIAGEVVMGPEVKRQLLEADKSQMDHVLMNLKLLFKFVI